MKYYLVTIASPNGYSFPLASSTDSKEQMWEAAKALRLAEDGDFDDASFDEITKEEYIAQLV